MSSLSLADSSVQNSFYSYDAQNNAYGSVDYPLADSLDSSTYASTFYDFTLPLEYNNNNTLNVPDLGNGSTRFVEQHEHQELGKWSLRQINRSARLLTDPWVQEILNNLAWRLNAQVRTQAPLALVVINDPNINAFAIPGGVIGINTGTVLSANSMDEVASVLAHEVAHLSQRHYEYRDDADTKAMLMQIGTLLGAIAAASADPDAATAIILGGQTAALNSQMAFSRDNEREADRIGMQILVDSGYDPRAMPRFFATLNQKSQLNTTEQSFLPSFIMTHPLSSERLSEAQTRANSYPTVSSSHYNDQQQLFDLLRWRTYIASGQAQENVLLSAAQQSVGARLALAIFYANKGRYNSASTILQPLLALSDIQRQVYEPLLSITQAQIASSQGDWAQAKALLQIQQQTYPERRDLRLYLADTLTRLQQPAQAQSLLTPLLERTPYDIEVLKRMHLAYENMATLEDTSSSAAHIATINALRYRSKTELWQGRYTDAQVSLQQAKILAESLSEQGINPKSLLAKIDNDRSQLLQVKAFNP